ncbi:MAG TPA: TonB-dependent receptor, partial [Thermoanaerobaculia bacterium]
EQFNNYQIEGVDNNETLVNSIAYLPPPEAIREFSVITTNAPAEYGRAAGAVQNLVIKSGTNDLRGSLYDFYRPQSLAAKPKFATTKPDFNNNDFGLTAGGPIFRDRTFFFGSFHGLRNSIPVEAGNYVTVPTQKMRNGDFSELLDPSVSGLSAPVIIYDPTTGKAFPNNVIPSTMFNAAGKAYLNAYPNPTRSGAIHNYLTQREKRDKFNDFDARVDQTMSGADQLFLSGSHWNDSFSDPGRIPGFQAGFGAGTSNNVGYTGRLGETHVFSPNLVNELRGGITNFHYGFLPVGFGTNQNAALGIGGPGGINGSNGIALIGGGDGTYIEYLGDFGQYVITQKTLELSDSVTWLKGNHSFKFGGTAMRRELNENRDQIGKGFYFFRDAFGASPGYTGYEVADMLIGKTTFTATGIPGIAPRDTLSWENALYAQDDWRVRSNLTLNLGLRWDVLTPYYERNNRIANYDPKTQTIIVPGNGVPRSTLNTNYDNFGPRLGFNYLLNDKTAVRGGYGIFYSLDRGGIDKQLTENPPYVLTQYRFSGPGSNVSLSDPIPLPDPLAPGATTLPPGTGVIFVPRDSKTPEVQQWNLGMQREIDSKTSAMVAYVGDRSKNLATVVSSPGFGGAIQTAVGAVMYIGTSKYDALQMSLRRVDPNGLGFLASYTFGNAKNDGPGFFAGNPSRGGSITDTSCIGRGTTDCNLSLDYGRADYDARHRFTLAATYAL